MLAFDEDTIITGCNDGMIRVLTVQPNRFLHVLGSHPGGLGVEALALGPGRRLLASVSQDEHAYVWSLDALHDSSDEVRACMVVQPGNGRDAGGWAAGPGLDTQAWEAPHSWQQRTAVGKQLLCRPVVGGGRWHTGLNAAERVLVRLVPPRAYILMRTPCSHCLTPPCSAGW